MHSHQSAERRSEDDVMDLTGDDATAKHAQHDLGQTMTFELLWLSTALEWGPLCTPATVMHWAEAMHQVKTKACTARCQ